MSKVTMPQYVAQAEEGDEGLVVEALYRDGECLVEHGDLLVTATQMEAYAAAKVREALGWQPISTAPQGCIALFYNANATEVRNCAFVDWTVDGKFYGNRHHTATHWMPLPPPPQHDNE